MRSVALTFFLAIKIQDLTPITAQLNRAQKVLDKSLKRNLSALGFFDGIAVDS